MQELISKIINLPIYQELGIFINKKSIHKDYLDDFSAIFNMDKKVRTYCTKCKLTETFRPLKSEIKVEHSSKIFVTLRDSYELTRYSIHNKVYFEKVHNEINIVEYDNLKKSSVNFLVKYGCSMNLSHEIQIYFSMFIEDKFLVIRKIGQNISPYLINLPNSRIYDKELKKYKCKDDYFKYYLHTIHGDHIAALLYLRRVFEKFVNHHVDEESKGELFSKKILNLKSKNVLDPETEDLSGSVYGLLSKGIHQLSDRECSELNHALFIFIEDQLIYQESLRKMKKRKDEARKRIESSTNKHT